MRREDSINKNQTYWLSLKNVLYFRQNSEDLKERTGKQNSYSSLVLTVRCRVNRKPIFTLSLKKTSGDLESCGLICVSMMHQKLCFQSCHRKCISLINKFDLEWLFQFQKAIVHVWNNPTPGCETMSVTGNKKPLIICPIDPVMSFTLLFQACSSPYLTSVIIVHCSINTQQQQVCKKACKFPKAKQKYCQKAAAAVLLILQKHVDHLEAELPKVLFSWAQPTIHGKTRERDPNT